MSHETFGSAYWRGVWSHLDLETQGIPFEFFLADPYLHLRRIGTGAAGVGNPLLNILPVTGEAN